MSVIISNALILQPGLADRPLTHARIGYRSIIPDSEYTATVGSPGFPFLSALNPATYESWRPTSPAVVNIDAGEPVPVDYIAMQQSGISLLTVEYSNDDIDYVEAISYSPGGDGATMGLFPVTTARYWRITIAGSSLRIIKLNLGRALAMQRAMYQGHSPINLSRITAVRPSVSETGQFLGSVEQRLGTATRASWDNLSAQWYRDNFDPFVAYGPRVFPFFFAWRPETFPDEVAYCWATNDIQPVNSGPRDLMTVDMDLEGYL